MKKIAVRETDLGSTAYEICLRLMYGFLRRSRGPFSKSRPFSARPPKLVYSGMSAPFVVECLGGVRNKSDSLDYFPRLSEVHFM
jgi:hypothetical protein